MQKTMLHPIRVRIIQLLAYNHSLTVAALADLMTDVPRPTIYRHIHILYENNIITVVKEQKIRGTYEREYGLNVNYEYAAAGKEGEIVSGLLLKLFSDFSSYFESQAAPVEDKLFFSVNSMLLTDDEMESMKEEMFDVIKKYMNYLPQDGRKTRTISMISSPCSKADFKEEEEV